MYSKYISNKDKNSIKDWLVRSIGSNDAIFLSIKYNTYTPYNKDRLICDIRVILSHLFRNLLGRHWIKSYNKMFSIYAVQEFGKTGENRHCHIIINSVNTKFDTRKIINSLNNIKERCKFDLFEKEQENNVVNIPHNHNKSIVASIIYSNNVFDYVIKEIKLSNNFDNFIFDNEIFFKN